MATFAALDKRMMRDVDRLHNYLWHAEEKIDGPKLLADLASEARDLDALLKGGGTLRRHASAIVHDTAKDKGRYGPALFELLTDSYNLAAAAAHVRKRDYKGAAEHVVRVVESNSIGTCAEIDAFSLVEAWEGGKIDFEEYAGRLADALQAKGVTGAGQYKRMLLVARTFGKEWDARAPKEQQAFAARAAVEAGAWCAIATRSIRETATGKSPRVPVRDFAAVVQKIVAGL